jgi:hypothetical protein
MSMMSSCSDAFFVANRRSSSGVKSRAGSTEPSATAAVAFAIIASTGEGFAA